MSDTLKDKEDIPTTANYIQQGEGPPVVMIHGFAASLHDWNDLIPELARNGYTSYALDLLGHGDSPKPDSRAYHMDWLFEHFLRWMKSLHLTQPAILIGHSLGGYIALEYARRVSAWTRGLVLVTGPTGSGKSTTLAAMIDKINKELKGHIITVEDPIEFIHRHQKCIVNQREIGTDTKSFANALKYALREDPDVILVGEMRDLETMEAAIRAAETGHLVFATLHTTGAAGTISRVIDAFPVNQQAQVRVQLSSSLIAVLSQVLLARVDKPGLVASYEFHVVTPAISNLIRENKTFRINSDITPRDFSSASSNRSSGSGGAKRISSWPGHGA